ncbi:MAG: terminase family protein [Candidatus Paceibacterota bacterium]
MSAKDINPDNIPEKNNEDIFPDHVPLIPLDTQREKEKEAIRKLAKELRKKGGKIEAIIVTKHNGVKKVSELTKQEQEDEVIRCGMNPIYFIETYLTIFDQTQGIAGEIVPFKLFDFQKELIKTYLENRFVIANKYRQAGVSTTTCAYIAWYVMFNANRQVAIVADKLEVARDELMNDVVDFIDGCPKWLRPKTGRETFDKNLKDTQKLKIYDNNSKLGAFSSKGLRGYTPTLIFWDETAWTEKGDKFWTSAKPTLQTGGAAIMVSTPSGLDAVFYKTFNGARNKENNFVAVELWWYNDPRYNKDLCWLKNKGKENEIKLLDENWDNRKRIQMMDEGWEASSPWFEDQVKEAEGDMRKIAQELLCSFLGSGDNFISEEYLKRIQDEEVLPPIRQEYLDKNVWIWEDPIVGETYIMALDASPGHGEDNSTMNMLKTKEVIEEKIITKNGKTKKYKLKRHKVEQVAEYYGKVTPQMLAEIAYQYGKRYNNAYCVVDITGGYGVQTVEKMLEYGYDNVHYAEVTHKPSRDRLQGYIKKGQKTMADGTIVNVDLIPGFFIGGNRASVVLEMQRAIHLEDVIIHSIRLLNELKTFVTVAGNRVADHKRSFHDDSIMGLSIGLYVLNFDMARYKQSKGITEKMLNAIITNNEMNEIGKRIATGNTKTHKPMISPNSTSPLNPYGVNAWLFNGIKEKKKN